jgi:outer membrane protein
MRVMTKVFAVAALLCCVALPAGADEMVSLKAGYQLLSPEGTFAVSSSALIGTPIDLETNLGYDDSENLTAELAFQFGPVRLSAGYLPIKFSGQGTLNQTVNFGGQTFSGTAQAASDVEIDLYDIGLVVNLLNFDDTPVRFQLGPELAVKIVDADLSMTGESTAAPGVRITESESVVAPIPTLGARARVGLADWVGLVGRVGYMEYQDNSFLDADAQIEFSPVPFFGIYGGYRYFDVQVDESEVLIDAQFSGPYVGAFLRF